MSYHFIFGVLGGLCSVVAIGFYVRSILNQETKPNRVSWVIWNVTNIILLASYFSVGARPTIFVPIIYVVNGLIVLILSFRYGISAWSRLDRVTLLVAGSSLLVWFLTQNSFLALLMVLTMDAIGYLPTIKKILVDPLSESQIAWFFIFLGTCFNLLAISSMSVGIIVYPIVMLTMNSITLAAFYRKKIISIFS